LIKEIPVIFKKPAARAAFVITLALAASTAMAGRDKDDDDKHHGGCGRHGKPACTVPEPSSLALTALASFVAIGVPAAMRRRRPKVISKI
jgi:hypothetical protein